MSSVCCFRWIFYALNVQITTVTKVTENNKIDWKLNCNENDLAHINKSMVFAVLKAFNFTVL